MKPYWLRNDITFDYDGNYSESTLRDTILRNINLVSHSSLQASKLFKKNNFLNFLSTQTTVNTEAISILSEDKSKSETIETEIAS